MKRFYLILLILPLMLLSSGCEPDDDEVRGELEVLPEETFLTGEMKGVVLTAEVGDDIEPIVYPLEWSVAFTNVGTIVTQSADRVAYLHTSLYAGGNVITVRDQIGREGIAVVSWEPEEDDEEEEDD